MGQKYPEVLMEAFSNLSGEQVSNMDKEHMIDLLKSAFSKISKHSSNESNEIKREKRCKNCDAFKYWSIEKFQRWCSKQTNTDVLLHLFMITSKKLAILKKQDVFDTLQSKGQSLFLSKSIYDT